MAWKKSELKHSQTFSCARFEFMDMLYGAASASLTGLLKRFFHGADTVLRERMFFCHGHTALLTCLALKVSQLLKRQLEARTFIHLRFSDVRTCLR
jgi:hypothetical protein